MWFLIGLVVGVIGGAVGMFFVMRNNPKYFNIDDMLKAERNKLLALGREKLEALRKLIDEILS